MDQADWINWMDLTDLMDGVGWIAWQMDWMDGRWMIHSIQLDDYLAYVNIQ